MAKRLDGYDVAIVGLGPVAATLAALLAQSGLSVLILEKEPSPYLLPRAVHIDGEVMRVFQQVGIADELAENLFVNLGMRFVDAEQNLLIDWPRPQGIGPQGWHGSYRFHQPDLERLLRVRLDEYEAITIHRGVEVIDIEEDADGATLVTKGEGNTLSTRFRCGFVVGCDGARSFVRNHLKAELIDFRSNAQWLVVDVLMHRAMKELSDWTIQLCDPQRPTTMARGVNNRRRWEFMLMPGDVPEKMIEEHNIWSLLARWITPSDAAIERSAIYRFQAAIASRWRSGRVLIAGDAAHQTPPFLGQGLCAGIRDASNLAWKLAAVLRGGASAHLLDSYQSERLPHVREFIVRAVRVGEVLQATPEQSAIFRDAAGIHGPERMVTPAPGLGPGIHRPDDPWGGVLVDQPRLEDGSLADNQVGQNWLLLVRPELQEKSESFLAKEIFGGRLAVLPARDTILDNPHLEALLIRPDRYAAASLERLDELPNLLDSLELLGSNDGKLCV